MSEIDLRHMSNQQLYERFVELSVKMGKIYHGSLRLYKRYHGERQKLTAEIKSRRIDTTSLFRPGLYHADPWVRLDVTRFCIEGAREETLAVLKELSALEFHSVRPRAGMSFDFYTTGDIIGEETREFTRKIRARSEASWRRQRGE